MFTIIDNYLNKITMYRLVLYCLIFLSIITLPLSLLKLLPFSPLEFLYSILILVSVSLITNKTFAWTFDAPTNKESVYITALILALIITPNLSEGFLHYTAFIFWAGAIAMASKYIFAINKKHLFNPVALSVVITSLIINQAASWWVGTIYMFPFVLITGFLIVRKIYRADLVFNFFIASFLSIIIFGMLKGTPPLIIFYNTLFKSSVLFFAFFMLTEPLTTPPTKILRIIYGVMVGVFFIPSFHIGKTFLTPEIALILGNVFSHLVSSKEKLFLKLKEKKIIANDTYEFSFLPDKKFNFTPGQYMEWTLDHSDQDDRGNRRYFTLASSPTETELKISVKFYLKSSSFKNKLLSLNAGDLIIASECAGDFTLPLDKNKKLVFMAGGIGITPFRSMLKYLADTNDQREITLIYCNKTIADIAYKEIFDEAKQKNNLKMIYILTNEKEIDNDTYICKNAINSAIIKAEIPDYSERIFYISGPHSMVNNFEKILIELGINKNKIKTDFFPGFV